MFVTLFSLALAVTPDQHRSGVELAYTKVTDMETNAREAEDTTRIACLKPKVESLGALVMAADQALLRHGLAAESSATEIARLEADMLQIAETKALSLAAAAMACDDVAQKANGSSTVEVEEPELADEEVVRVEPPLGIVSPYW